MPFLNSTWRCPVVILEGHSGRGETIQIIKTAVVADADAKRQKTIEFSRGGVKFPKTRTIKRAPVKNMQTMFKAERPTLF